MPGWTRRQWLQAMTGVAVAGVGGCGDRGPATALVLEVDATRAIIAAWSAFARHAVVRITSVTGAPAGQWRLEFGADGTGWIDATGLAPATQYRARITASDQRDLGELAFTTAPRDDDPRPVRLAVSADLDESVDYASPIFEAAVRAEPELFVSLGDWPYADNGPAAVTRDEYHGKYVVNRLEPRLAPWLRSTSFRAIYDDHEFANDWDEAARTADPARHAAATAVWDAWFPRRGGGPRYRSWRWGALVECFLLDCRAYRSAVAAPDRAGKTMLGAEQRAWLLAGLAASTAPFCLVFTSVPLDFGYDRDHWAGYTTERDAIFDALAIRARPGVLFVSADQHWFAAHRHRYGLREFQVGPLSRGVNALPDSQPAGVITRDAQYNFGVIEIDASPRLTFRAVGATGATFYAESFAPDDLTPRA